MAWRVRSLFGAVVVLCAAARPDYSHIDQFISELGATGSSRASLMNYAGVAKASWAMSAASSRSPESP